jgi:hypothetical protein
MSALRVTVVVAVGLLPAGFGSGVGLVTVAVFVIVAPVAPGLIFTVMEKVAVPGGNETIVQLTLPVPPTEGVLQENVGPTVCDSETNVVLAGTVSVRETFAALDGPLFVSVTV